MLKNSICSLLLAACLLACVTPQAADTTITPPMLESRPNAFVMDANGRQYILGAFSSSADLNPGVGEAAATQVATGSDLFILCLGPDSGYLWSRTLGTSFGVSPTTLAVANGNVYIAGSLGNTNPVFENGRASQTTLTATAGPFVLSLQAADGSLNTGFGTGGILNVPAVNSIAQMVAGTNLYLSGTLTVDGHSVDLLALNASTGSAVAGFSGFVSASLTNHILALSDSTLYVAGTFSGTLSINGGTAVNSTSSDGFIAAFNLTDGTTATGFSTDGIQTFGGDGDDRIQSLSVSDGKVYASGRFASANAGIGGTGSITRAGAQPDAFLLALDTSGNPVASFDSDGVAVFANPFDLATGQALCSAEFGAGVATPGIAFVVQWAEPVVNGEVTLFDLDSSGAPRTGFGLSGKIKFGGGSTETTIGVQRMGGQTALGVRYGGFNQIISAPNLVERFLSGAQDIVAAFASDTGTPLFPYFTDVFPRAADIAGGSPISVMGNGFGPGSSLVIGTAPVTGVNIVNPQKFTATVPPGTPGEKGGSLTFMPSNRRITFGNFASPVDYGAIFVYGNKAEATGPVFQASTSGGGASGAVYDAEGNLYVCGSTPLGAKDYDPSAGVAMHSSVPGTVSSFITRINANGSYGWTALFDSLGGSQLNDLAVVGNRVYAVGHTIGNSNPNRASHSGINGLGNVRVKGVGDGVILVLDRATGTAVTAVDGDGIVVIGGSDDTSSFDALHSIAKTGTNTLTVGGRIASTNAQIGAGPAPANPGEEIATDEPIGQGATVINFDINVSTILKLVYGYADTPPNSSIPSVKFEFSEDSSQLTVGVMSGSQVDLYQLDASLVAVPGFGIGGKISLIGTGPVSKFSIAANENEFYVSTVNTDGSRGTIYNGSTDTGVTTQPVFLVPIVETPQPRIDSVVITLSGPNHETLGVSATATGDFTCERGASSRTIDSECTNTLDANAVIFEGNYKTAFEEFCDSIEVCKGSGNNREEITVIVPPPGANAGFTYIGSSGGPTFNLDTVTFDVQGFNAFSVNRTGANPPKITSPLTIFVPPGVPLTYVITAINFDTVGASGSLAWLQYDGAFTLTGTPPAPGVYTYTIRADIPSASDIQTLTINVGQKPVINSSLNELVDIGEAFEYTSTIQGGNGTVTINPGNGTGYTVTPTSSDKLSATFNTPGIYAFTVTATNEYGTTTGTLIVEAKYLKPKLQGPFEISALTTDRPKTVTIAALGSPTINYTLLSVTFASGFDTAKAYMEYDSAGSSAKLIQFAGNSLTIDSKYALTATVKIKAQNSFGSDTRDYVVTVALADGAPRITSPLTAIVAVGKPVIYTLTAIGDPVIKRSISSNFVEIGETLNSTFTGADEKLFLFLRAENDKGIDTQILVVTFVNLGDGANPPVDTDGDGFTNSQDEDDDGDGIPDRTELGAGTNPLDPKDFPSGADVVNISVGKFKATSVTVVSDGPNDSILDQVDEASVGIVQALSRASKPAVVPGTLLYEFGGVVRLFTIDAKGQGVSGNDKCTIKLKSKAGVVTASIKVSIKKADLKAALADEGFTDRSVKKETLTVGSFIAYNRTGINRVLTMEYTAKQGKKGAAKLKK